MMIWPSTPEQQKLHELYGINMSEEDLRERVVAPYKDGRSITWQGRTLSPHEIGYIRVYQTEHSIQYRKHHEYDAISDLPEVTNDWITGPPGAARAEELAPAPGAAPDPRRVMVVHGRNVQARDAVFAFLRSLSLVPIDAARTILVELGTIRHTTDFEGLNAVRLTNDPERRAALRTRLKTAGCDVDDSGTQWTSEAGGGDFDACVVPWQPQLPLSAAADQQSLSEESSGIHGRDPTGGRRA